MHSGNLILVEGIPGSGKTTTASFIKDWLLQQGRQPALFLEGDWDHPADFESVACLDEEAYAEIQTRFADQADILAQYARNSGSEWFFSYRKMQHEQAGNVTEDLITALARYEIYDLPADKFQRLIRQRWQKFASHAAGGERVYTFECCFLQNPLTTLLARHNFSPQVASGFVIDLAEIIRPLKPQLVYLRQSDVRATLEKGRSERPPEWAEYVTWYMTSGAYGQARGLSGYAGVIEFYTERQQIELELLETLLIPSLIISDEMRWENRYQALKAFLEN
jgi:hypothetical protein